MSNHITTHKLCFNCLGARHQTRECRSLSRCKKCSGKHHSLLHRDQAISSGPVEATRPTESIADNVWANHAAAAIQPTLMMTRQIMLEGPFRQKLVARALLDSGASMSLVSNRAVQCLQLPRIPQHHSVRSARTTKNCLVT